MSAKYSLDSSDWKHVLRAVVYSGLSAALTALTVVLANPSELSWKTLCVAVGVPAFNGMLVAVKRFVDSAPLESQSQ